MARIRFVQTLRVQHPVRVRTSRTEVQFVDPDSGVARQNDFDGKVIEIPPGAMFHVVCSTTKPDQTTGILELRSGKKITRAGVVLRKLGWNQLQDACQEERSLPLNPKSEVDEMSERLHAKMSRSDVSEDSIEQSEETDSTEEKPRRGRKSNSAQA